MGDGNKVNRICHFLFFIIGSLYGCSNSEIDCDYLVYNDIKLTVSNKIIDIGIQDYECIRDITMIHTINDKNIKFNLPKSFQCDFFIKRVLVGEIDVIIFYNIDNPLNLAIDVTNMKVMPESFYESIAPLSCNCNIAECKDAECINVTICKYE